MDSSRRDFIIRAAALGSIAAIPAIGAPDVRTEAEPKKREIARLRDVRLDGELGARYQAATCNILTRQDRYSLESFRSSASGVPGALWWDWPGDQIGRYLSVLHVASGCGWTPAHGRRAEILDAVLPLQGGAGNFGPEKPDQTNVQFISGNAFALRGLLDAYEDGGDPRALNGARRLARYFEAAFDYYKDKGARGRCANSTDIVWMASSASINLVEMRGRWILPSALVHARAGLITLTIPSPCVGA
jgi:hypothetical protein